MTSLTSSNIWRAMCLALCVATLTTSVTLAAASLRVIRPAGNPTRGRDVFSTKGCVACHSVRGTGGKVGPDLAVSLVNKGILDIAAEMWSHAPAMDKVMPAKGLEHPALSPAEVNDLIAYLLFIGFTGEPGDAFNGRLLFNTKGCVKCHAFGGNGGKVGPSLDPMTRTLSPIGIAQEMWNHGPQMQEKMAQMQIRRPLFKYGEMADLMAFLVGPGRAELPSRRVALPGDPQSGAKLFASKGCAVCHQPGVTGKTVGPDLSKGGWYRTATEMAAVMWNHGPGMAEATEKEAMALPHFTGNELADILAYLYVLKSAERLGDPSRGERVFTSKSCSRCHGKDGPGPDLSTSQAVKSPAHLASAMWNHVPQMQQAARERGITWPSLTGDEIRDLVSFLVSGGASNAAKPE